MKFENKQHKVQCADRVDNIDFKAKDAVTEQLEFTMVLAASNPIFLILKWSSQCLLLKLDGDHQQVKL